MLLENNKFISFDLFNYKNLKNNTLYQKDLKSFDKFINEPNNSNLFHKLMMRVPLILEKKISSNKSVTEFTTTCLNYTITNYSKNNEYKLNIIYNYNDIFSRYLDNNYYLAIMNFNSAYSAFSYFSLSNALNNGIRITNLNEDELLDRFFSKIYFVLVDSNGNQVFINNDVEEQQTISSNCNSSTNISWEEYFMGIAYLSSLRSKDPNTKVGACIVKDNKILSMGYNGFPLGCNDNNFSWESENKNPLKVKDLFVVHSELNAILNYKGDLSGSTIYVTMFPCNECTKAIIQTGIKEIVYKDEYRNETKVKASKMMLQSAGVKYRKYNKSGKQEIINF